MIKVKIQFHVYISHSRCRSSAGKIFPFSQGRWRWSRAFAARLLEEARVPAGGRRGRWRERRAEKQLHRSRGEVSGIHVQDRTIWSPHCHFTSPTAALTQYGARNPPSSTMNDHSLASHSPQMYASASKGLLTNKTLQQVLFYQMLHKWLRASNLRSGLTHV